MTIRTALQAGDTAPGTKRHHHTMCLLQNWGHTTAKQKRKKNLYSSTSEPTPSITISKDYQLNSLHNRGISLYLLSIAAAAAKSLQLCLTLCDPIDGSPPGSPVPGILPARTLEWVAISFSDAWKWKVKGKSLSRVQLLATPWTAAYQAPLSMGFSRWEYWSGVPLPSLYWVLEFIKTEWKSLKRIWAKFYCNRSEPNKVLPHTKSSLKATLFGNKFHEL